MTWLPVTSLLALLSAVVFAGCSGEPEPELIDDEKVESAEERVDPTVTLLTPQRGIFTNANRIVVSGTVRAGSSPIQSVTVNDTPAQRSASGEFTLEVAVRPGPNIIGIRAEAEDGGRAVDALSVFGAEVHGPGATIRDAMQIHLGRAFFDDDDPDLDDVATVVETLVSDEQFLQAFTAEPFMIGDDSIRVTSIEVGAGDVDIAPETNCLDATVTINDASLELETEGLAAIFGETVFVDAEAFTIRALTCGTSDTSIELEVVESDVTFDNLVLATDENPDLKEDLPSTHDALQTLLEGGLARWIGGSLGGLLGNFLADFSISYTVGMAPALTFVFDATKLEATPGGLAITLEGAISTPAGLPMPPEGAGSLRTHDAALDAGFSAAPVALAVSDDTLNQLLFALYWSNSIATTELPPEAASELPEIFQPLTSLDMQMAMPATIVPATLQDEFPYDIAIGGVSLDILAGQDRRIGAGLHFRAGANLIVDEGGLFTLKLDNRAQKITVQANVTESPDTVEAGDLAALLRFMVPPILGQVEVAYGGLPVPDIELSSFSENAAAFEGRTLRFVPSASLRQGGGGGYLVVEGTFQESTDAPSP